MIRFIQKALIVSITTLVLIVLLEITLRTFFPQDAIVTYEKGSLGLTDETLGHSNRPGSHTKVHTPEFKVEYRISDEGFRDEVYHSVPKKKDSTRVLILGDSFTFGIGNQYEDIWPVISESNLVKEGYKTQIIKAGVPAYDTTKEVLLLERIYPEYKPDIVVLVFLANDVFTNSEISESTSSAKDKTVIYRKDKKSSLNILTLYKRILLSNDWIYSKLYMLTGRSLYFNSPPTNILENQLNVTKELLLRAAGYCRDRGAEFMVFSIPQQFQVIYKANGFDFENTDVEIIDARLRSFAEENGILWISVLDELVKYRKNGADDLYYRLDGHLDREGNRVVGNYFTDAFIGIYGSSMNK